jgi:hypothetical protein
MRKSDVEHFMGVIARRLHCWTDGCLANNSFFLMLHLVRVSIDPNGQFSATEPMVLATRNCPRTKPTSAGNWIAPEPTSIHQLLVGWSVLAWPFWHIVFSSLNYLVLPRPTWTHCTFYYDVVNWIAPAPMAIGQLLVGWSVLAWPFWHIVFLA